MGLENTERTKKYTQNVQRNIRRTYKEI